MFDGFTCEFIDLGEVTLRVRHGGHGPAVLLLHGHPRTHATWEHVAPLLAQHFTVVCPDLRGYGQSSKPPTDEQHAPYSKRAMAADCVALMQRLGHTQFAIAGHDRGAYVAFRCALDHPDRISKLVIMDAIPLADAFARCNAQFALEWWHWFFFAQPAPRAERAICADPEAWYNASPAHKSPEAFQDYLAAIHNPQTVHAMMEDYRAGATIDREHDEADRAAGKRVRCPTLILWAKRDDLERLYGDPLEPWRAWTHDVRGGPIDSGHHMAEEAPEALAAALIHFFRGDVGSEQTRS
jgi:haloacetate dehalogenase